MKFSKKILTSILALSVLGSALIVPISSSAIAITDDIPHKELVQYYQENSIKDGETALITVNFKDGTSKTFYLKHDISKFPEPVEVTEDLNISSEDVDKVYTIGENSAVIPIDTGYSYTDFGCSLDEKTGEIVWFQNESSIPKVTVGDSTTIGDSTTVGDSEDYYQQFIDAEPTNIRGDINYDGKVNSADILFLRRYLLHLLKW